MFKNATQIRNINKSDIVKKIPYRFDLVDFVFCIVKIGSSAFILSLFSKFLTFLNYKKLRNSIQLLLNSYLLYINLNLVSIADTELLNLQIWTYATSKFKFVNLFKFKLSMPSSESDFNSFVSETPFELLSCQIWGIFKKILSRNFKFSPRNFRIPKLALSFGLCGSQ